MTRVYALLASLILIASPMAGCLTGEDIEDIEEIIDDILGCMDENAENYAENATAELLGDCIYLASMEIFITAMTEQMEIDEMLEIVPRAGYSMSITMSEWNTDANMQMDTVIEEMVMADLDTDSVYVKNSISIVPFMTYEFTQIQVGELVNVHYTLGGMMAGEGAGMGSYQTRDADPDVMDVISSLVSVSDAGDTGEEVGLDLPTGDVSDLFSEMPADTEPVITYEDETGVQTMTLEYTNDTGHDTSIVILIDENEELMSYHISTDNGSATSSISYTVMWGDAVVIEVDDTLPRTSIPINFHVEGMPEDNWDEGGDDTFYCDNGNEIPMDWVDDGADDCGDGSDESGGDDDDLYWTNYNYCEWEGDEQAVGYGDDTRWFCKYDESDDDWADWWYYCEYDGEDETWYCTDAFGQSEDYEYSADGTEHLGGDDGGDEGDDGPPTPEEAMYVTDTNGDDNMSLDEFVDFWNSDNPDAQIDSDNSFLTTSDVSDLIGMCDYDGNEMIDINEMQCFIDNLMDMIPDGDDASADDVFEWMNADGDGQVTPSEWADFANTTGDIIDGDDFDNLNYMMDMYDYDESGGLDMYEFAELWDEINDDDDDGGDGDGEDDSPFRVTMMVIDQTLNAPISDFEVRFLGDCGEPDEEGNEPPISNCKVYASNGITEGFASVDPEITEYEFTYQYLDLDGDGMISTMDTLVIDNLMPGVKVELYDTWADQYTSDSYATSQVPGFGALMAVVVLLGAAFATRRD
jgi:PGF-CTERM protein